MSTRKTVGVLALQGSFSLHLETIASLGHIGIEVRHPEQLKEIDALIIPGGESTTLLRLTNQEFRDELIKAIDSGLPTLATCAGLIFIAKTVSNPMQESLGLLDVEVSRNAYGRQLDSFIDPQLRWKTSEQQLEGVFIRAPKITSVGENIEVLVEREAEPVLVKQGNIFGATFHPELSDTGKAVHQLFLADA